MEVERDGDEQGAVGPEDAADFFKAFPEAAHVFKGFQGQDRADGAVGLRQRLDLADHVHARPRPHVEADVLLARKE